MQLLLVVGEGSSIESYDFNRRVTYGVKNKFYFLKVEISMLFFILQIYRVSEWRNIRIFHFFGKALF